MSGLYVELEFHSCGLDEFVSLMAGLNIWGF